MHPTVPWHTQVKPLSKKQGKTLQNLPCCPNFPGDRSLLPPLIDEGTSGALQTWPWLCTRSKPGLWCHQQPPCTSNRGDRTPARVCRNTVLLR